MSRLTIKDDAFLREATPVAGGVSLVWLAVLLAGLGNAVGGWSPNGGDFGIWLFVSVAGAIALAVCREKQARARGVDSKSDRVTTVLLIAVSLIFLIMTFTW